MNNQDKFLLAIDELKKMARLQDNVVTSIQMEDFFQENEIGFEQRDMVCEYLKANHIGIDQVIDDEEHLSKEEKSYLDIYLTEIEDLNIVSSNERERILRSAFAGDVDAKRRMIELFLPKVVEIAKLYAGQGVYLEDLIGEGNVSITLGAEMIGCLEHPDEIEGFLGKMVMDAMEDLIGMMADGKNTDMKMIGLVNKVQEISEELAMELHKKVTIAELIRDTELSEDEIREALRLAGDNLDYIEL